jgi:hypothetical protein
MKPEDIENADIIIAMDSDNATHGEIATALNMSIPQVRRRRTALGLGRSAYVDQRHPNKLEWTSELDQMWNNQVSLRAIAKKIGCDRVTITRMAASLGKPPRTDRVDPLDILTPDQLQDIATLRNFGDTKEVATRKVTAPKVKVRAQPRQHEARA